MQARVDKLVHDVRGALNTINMNAELARLLSSQPNSQDKIQQCLRVIVRECGLCNAVMEDFRHEVQRGQPGAQSSSEPAPQ